MTTSELIYQSISQEGQSVSLVGGQIYMVNLLLCLFVTICSSNNPIKNTENKLN